MKIRNVEIWDTNCQSPMPWHPILIRINTDEGISGLGEVGLAYGAGHSGGAGFVKNLAERYLIGADPLKVEALWDRMFRDTFWGQGGGPVVFGAMSAIDIACWDIRGKAFGLPIYQLLGGKTNESLRTYASQIQFGWGPDKWESIAKAEDYGKEAALAVEEGYDAIKVDPVMCPPDQSTELSAGTFKTLVGIQKAEVVKMVHDRIASIRNAVGDDVDIIIELHCSPSVASAIQIGNVCEEFNCMYMEEPVHYLNAALQKAVSDNVKIPMAAGERLYTRWGYRQYFEQQSLRLIQPDPCLVGGITEAKKVCDYAYMYDVTVQMHVCGSPVSAAAALQIEAAIPNFQIHEHHTINLKQYNREICVQDYQPVNGKMTAPDAPGLGIDLNEKFLATQNRIVVE